MQCVSNAPGIVGDHRCSRAVPEKPAYWPSVPLTSLLPSTSPQMIAVGSVNVMPPSNCRVNRHKQTVRWWTADDWPATLATKQLTECLYPRNRKFPCRVGSRVSAMKRVFTRSSRMGALLLAPALLADIPAWSDIKAFTAPLLGSSSLRSLRTKISLALCTRLLCLHGKHAAYVEQLLVAAPWLPILSARRDIGVPTSRLCTQACLPTVVACGEPLREPGEAALCVKTLSNPCNC